MTTEQLIPPPWSLRGRGVILLYSRLPEDLVTRWVPGGLPTSQLTGPAVVMFVDYEQADCGPYRELLFIPGRLKVGARRYPSITRILVSTTASVVNGRHHWAIPKERADFHIDREGAHETWQVVQGDVPVASLSLRATGPKLPITTRLAPASWCSVAQPRDGRWMLTRLAARGWMRWATDVAFRGNEELFPDLGTVRPVAAVVVEPFSMIFPIGRELAATA